MSVIFTDIKLDLDSCATAAALSVLPVPGGPYNKMPLGTSTRRPANNSRWLHISEYLQYEH